jgi:hypothetical protein
MRPNFIGVEYREPSTRACRNNESLESLDALRVPPWKATVDQVEPDLLYKKI